MKKHEVVEVPKFTQDLLDYQLRNALTVEQLAVRAKKPYFTIYRWLRGWPAGEDAETVVRQRLGI